MTRQLLWAEYYSFEPEGYNHTQYCQHLSDYIKRNQATMHFEHSPGEFFRWILQVLP